MSREYFEVQEKEFASSTKATMDELSQLCAALDRRYTRDKRRRRTDFISKRTLDIVQHIKTLANHWVSMCLRNCKWTVFRVYSETNIHNTYEYASMKDNYQQLQTLFPDHYYDSTALTVQQRWKMFNAVSALAAYIFPVAKAIADYEP